MREPKSAAYRSLGVGALGLVSLALSCARFGFEEVVFDPNGAFGNSGDSSSLECSLGTLSNCSACGDDCASRGWPRVADLACISAACGIASCQPGYADCDTDPDNGCEAALDSADHCGACGTPCNIANAEATCSEAACAFVSCAPGFGDCDSDVAANGCERPLEGLTNCGGCGVPCSLPNAQTTCDSGTCELTGCANGFDDCDGNPNNGCETPLDTTSDCGGCGVPCNIAGAACSGGVCSTANCTAFLADCDADGVSCETDLKSLSDCVGCGVPCGDQAGRLDNASASCASGSCGVGTCDFGFDDCDNSALNGCETQVTTLIDCGSCGVSCNLDNATASCSTGSCAVIGCSGGFDDCDGADANGCEAQIGSDAHCGGCNQPCGANETCSGGSCVGQFSTYTPSNIAVAELDPATAPDLLLNCGTVTIDTTSLNVSGWCGGQPPALSVQEQDSGPELLVVPLRSLVVTAGTTLRASGARPLALVVFGDVDVSGSIDVSANGATGGAGNHWNCFSSLGGNGTGTSTPGGGGGGGGAFRASGGRGGNGGAGAQGGIAGIARGSDFLLPLIPGCNGGWGGGCGANPGGGGGAVQLAATGRIDLSGSILSRGGDGAVGCGARGGASGGGSGGGILIEGNQIFISGTLLASGGRGGNGANGGSGGLGSGTGAGQDGTTDASNGGGGGGGSAGRVRIVGAQSCSLGGSSTPAASAACP